MKKGVFGGCAKEVMQVEYFDLRDPATRDKLIHMGFVAKVRGKVLP